jgi:outer membrane protein assembly factor BamB
VAERADGVRPHVIGEQEDEVRRTGLGRAVRPRQAAAEREQAQQYAWAGVHRAVGRQFRWRRGKGQDFSRRNFRDRAALNLEKVLPEVSNHRIEHRSGHGGSRRAPIHMRHNAKFLLAALLLFGFVSAFDQPAGTKLWEFYTGQPIQSSPALGADGTVYFGADNGKLYAFDPQGNGKWEFPTGDALVASPAIAADGTVIIGSVDGQCYAIGADGVEQWRFRANGKIVSSPAIGLDGAIHFGSMRNTLYALNPDGTKRWEFTADDALVASPAIGRDGTVYAISLNGTLYAVDLAGKQKWQFKAGDKVNSSPALGADGTIYFGAFDGHVYAVKPTGSKRWTFATGAAVRGSAAVGPDGVIYIGSDDRKLYALAPDGFKRWTFTTGGWVRSTPAIGSDGTVYVGSYDNSFYAVSPEGAKLWEFGTGSAISSSPALTSGGVLYFGGWSKRFYAVKGGSSLAPGAWAKFRGDARQTAFAESEFALVPIKPPAVRPAFPVEEPKPVAVTSRTAAAEEFARAQAARELAMAAKKDSATRTKAAVVPPPVAPKPLDTSAEAKQFAKAEADANRKMLAENARVLKDAELARKAQEKEDYRRALSAADLARNAKREAGLREAAMRKAAADAERLAKAEQEAGRKGKDMESARLSAEAKAQAEADRKAAMEIARQTKLQQDAERTAAEALAKADAQAEIEKSKRVLEESRRMLKEAEEARKLEKADEARRAAAAAELARLAKQEADQRAAAKRKADADVALQAKTQADAERRAAMESARQTKLQQEAEQAEAARKLAEAKAQAEAENKATAEAARMSAKEQEIARKVMADSERAAREELERQSREAAREQAAERRRQEAERQKWEPVSGGFFRRLFGGGSSEPKAKAEAPAAPTIAAPAASEPQSFVAAPPTVTPVPVPIPVVTTPVVNAPVAPPPPAVTAPVATAPSVPLKIISDSSDLARPAAPAPPPASFFTPTQATVDPLAEQIEMIKQRAAAAQAQPPQFVQPVVPQPTVPQMAAPQVVQPVAEAAVEPQAPEEKPGFWSRVGGFFIRTKKDPQGQPTQPQTAQQQRPVAPWPPANIVVRDPRAAAPGSLTSTNFPRVQYAPVTNQNNLFLSRAMGMQTNVPGMPQPPSQPREVREMRPSKIGTQGLSADLPGAAAPIEIIQGRTKAVLRVYATGAGRVIPDLNGAELEVGQVYTVEAQPSRGAVFLGWTGSLETNSPVLRFIMRTGTILSANFQFGYNMERELPEVAILSPADGARLNSPAFALQGAARDNLAVARVEVSVNDGPWEPAQGTDNWVFQSAARPGPNYVRVRAVDQAGNESQPLVRSLYYSVPSQLTVRVNGAGTVEPDWGGRLLDVGGAYELRATPAAGHVFAGWSGGVSGASPLLQFTMQTNLLVEANFAPRVASLARGVFNGLVYPTNSLVPAKCGFFQIEVGADGSFTGFLRQGISSHPLTGRFDLNGQATSTLTRANQTPVTVSLQLDSASGERLNGRFHDDGTGIEMFAYRQVFDGRSAVSPLAGRYTFVMPSPTNVVNSPAGDAFGEIVVDGAGNVRFAGELPDGTPVRHEAIMARNGLWPLHVPLAGGRGMLLGWITVSKDPNLDAFGEVLWHKPLSPQDRYYPGGFSTRRHLFGNLYTPTGMASSGGRDIGGMLSGGNLDKVVLGDSRFAATSSPGPRTLQRFTWNFRPETGYVEGTFTHPATQQETAFRGALLQKRGWTSGYFLGQNHSGVVHLQLPQ